MNTSVKGFSSRLFSLGPLLIYLPSPPLSCLSPGCSSSRVLKARQGRWEQHLQWLTPGFRATMQGSTWEIRAPNFYDLLSNPVFPCRR